jgi:hypothetical protein
MGLAYKTTNKNTQDTQLDRRSPHPREQRYTKEAYDGQYIVIALRAYGRWSVSIVLNTITDTGYFFFLAHRLFEKTGGMLKNQF